MALARFSQCMHLNLVVIVRECVLKLNSFFFSFLAKAQKTQRKKVKNVIASEAWQSLQIKRLLRPSSLSADRQARNDIKFIYYSVELLVLLQSYLVRFLDSFLINRQPIHQYLQFEFSKLQLHSVRYH